MHGGKSLSGVDHPSYKHGGRVRNLPARLMQRYQEAQADPNLLELRQEISLIDVRLDDLLGRVDTHEAGHWWGELNRLHTEYRKAIVARDEERERVALAELGNAIRTGHADYAAWDEVYNVLEQRRKLVESERKRLVEAQQTLTVERAMALIGYLVNIVRTHVSDPIALAAISADVGKLLAANVSNENS